MYLLVVSHVAYLESRKYWEKQIVIFLNCHLDKDQTRELKLAMANSGFSLQEIQIKFVKEKGKGVTEQG